MLKYEVAQRRRRTLIEQDSHLRYGERATGSVLQHDARLFKCDARKQFRKLAYLHAIVKVFEESRDWHARATKHPCATHALGVEFDSRTGRPVNHEGHRSTEGEGQTYQSGARDKTDSYSTGFLSWRARTLARQQACPRNQPLSTEQHDCLNGFYGANRITASAATTAAPADSTPACAVRRV